MRKNDPDAARKLSDAARAMRDGRLRDTIRYTRSQIRAGLHGSEVNDLEQRIGTGLEDLRKRLGDAAASVGNTSPRRDGRSAGQGPAGRTRAPVAGRTDAGAYRPARTQRSAGAAGPAAGQQGHKARDSRANRGSRDRGSKEQGQQGQQANRVKASKGSGPAGPRTAGHRASKGSRASKDSKGKAARAETAGGTMARRPTAAVTVTAIPTAARIRGEPSTAPGIAVTTAASSRRATCRQYRGEVRRYTNQVEQLRRALQGQKMDAKELDEVLRGLRRLDDDRVYQDAAELTRLQSAVADSMKRFGTRCGARSKGTAIRCCSRAATKSRSSSASWSSGITVRCRRRRTSPATRRLTRRRTRSNDASGTRDRGRDWGLGMGNRRTRATGGRRWHEQPSNPAPRTFEPPNPRTSEPL